MENFRAADVEIQAKFRHENIAELYGALLWDQKLHLFMEAGEGGSVLEKVDSCGPMREFEIIWVTRQVLRGLEYLHANKVIHHDIKRKPPLPPKIMSKNTWQVVSLACPYIVIPVPGCPFADTFQEIGCRNVLKFEASWARVADESVNNPTTDKQKKAAKNKKINNCEA